MATNGIKEIKVSNTNYLIEPTLYTTIKQTSAAATFTADLANFELFTGVTVAVKFGVTNNDSATLNINGTGAKAIYYEGAAIAASKLKAKHTYVFTYNGTQWELIGDLDTNTHMYHKSGSWSGLTYTAIAVNNADELKFTIPDNYGDTKNPYGTKAKNLVLAGPSSGNNAAPSFRALIAADIPNLSWNKITSDKPTTLNGYGITDAVKTVTSTDNAVVRFNGTSGQVQDSGLIINDNDMLTIPGGSKVYSVSSANQSGYVKWATLTISGAYQNEPIVFEISRRGDAMSTIIQVQFQNTSSSDPTLTSFTYYGSCANIYIKKSATSTWDLYASKTENYDLLCVLRYHNPYNSKINVEWKSEHITDAVEDWTQVSVAPIKVSSSNKTTAANLTTTSNAIAYYTNTTGTFGSKASANGALYATSANGALQWGTLPIAQGGTGKTSAAEAWTALGGGASGKHDDSYFALASHGNHVPATQTANNITFLRNDNSWYKLTKNEVNTLINLLDTGSSDLTSNDYVITQYVGGGTTTTTYHRRPASKVVNATLVKAALGTVSTTAKKFLKDTGAWTQVDWGDLTGKPSTFTPATHTHSHLVSLATINSGDSENNTHAAALKKYFDDNKSTVPRNSLVNFYSSAYGNGSQAFGYWLSSYDNNPYGGFFVAHYNTPKYVGILNGTYTQVDLITSGTIGSQSVNYATSAGTAGSATTAGAFSSGTTVKLTGDTTGESSSSTKGWSVATTTKFLSGTAETSAAITTSPGTGKIRYSYNVNNGTDGLFSANDNSNSIITLNRHNGNYNSQLGFSSNGNIYYRKFTGSALDATTAWKQLAYTDSTVARATADASGNTITSTYAPIASPTFTGTPKAPTAANGTSTTQIATTEFVNNTLAYANAMTFKGTLGTGGTITALPASHNAGDTYRVITAGTWAGKYCEVGTLIICTTDGTAANDAHWTSVETNEDGAIIGPSSSTTNSLAFFNSTTGRVINSTSKITVYNDVDITVQGATKKRNGIRLSGTCYGNTATDLTSNTAGVMRYEDGGVRIEFSADSTDNAALLYTNHDYANTGGGSSFHFVGQNGSNNTGGNLAVTAPDFVARRRMAVGYNFTDTNYALKVTGASLFTGNFEVRGNTIRLRNANNDNNQAGTAPYVTSLLMGDGPYVAFNEFHDDWLAIQSRGLVLNVRSSPIAVYDATKTYAVGDVVWYDKNYYICNTAITTAEAWTAGHWSLRNPSGAILSEGSIIPWANNTYTLGNSSYKWSTIYATTFSGNATSANYINLYETRQTTTTLNKTANYVAAGAMFHLVASSSTSATDNGKTPTDANILQMNWDNSGGYDAQLGIATGVNRMYFRARPSEKTAWDEVAHAPANTQVGSTTQPIYMSNDGTLTAGTALGASAYHADSYFALAGHNHNSTYVSINNTNRSYNLNKVAYVGGTSKKYAKIILPDNIATIWGMYYIELSLRYDWQKCKGGKILINTYHNSTSPYAWQSFNAELLGNFGDEVKIYGSDGKYFYIQPLTNGSTYSTISINKILVGDAAASVDISALTIEWIDTLPETTQEATIYYGVLETGVDKIWDIGVSYASKAPILIATKTLTSSDDENTLTGTNQIAYYNHINTNRPANCPSYSYNSGLLVFGNSRGQKDTFQLEWSGNAKELYMRGWAGTPTTIPSWNTIIHSGNYTTYAVAKTAGVTAVTWDATNKKLTRTIDGTAVDVMTAEQMSTALGLGTIASKAATDYLPVKYSNLDYTSAATSMGVYPINGQVHPVTGKTEYGGALQFGGTSTSNNYYAAQLLISSESDGTSPVHAHIRRMTSTPGWSNWTTLLDSNNYSSYTLPLSGGKMTGDIEGNSTVAIGTTTNPFHNIVLGGTTNATMTAASTNPRITFQEGAGTQPVHLIYTDQDSYRSPAGLKVIGGSSATPAWFEVEGNVYATAFKGKADTAYHTSAAHWYTSAGSPTGVIKVKIKKKQSWMLAFTIRVYQGYTYDDYVISGYNYNSNKWYSPEATILGSESTSKHTVTFGYDDDADSSGYRTLWVSIPVKQYTGIDIFNVTNGFSQITDMSDAFEIIHETESTGTVQITVDCYRPWYRNETVSNAATATTATWVGKGTHTAAITANEFTPAVGAMTVLGNVSNTTMTHANNANAEIIIKAHPTSGTNYYEARLGFSSNGTIQHMPVNGTAWKTILDSSNYSSYALPLSGGQMTGPLTWKNGDALPESTTGNYYLIIDAFANGGTTKWINKANIVVGKADAITTAGTTAQFYRGDNSWSDTISGGTLKITNNSNTVTIGSQNTSFCHIYNSANIPFIFNKAVLSTGANLGSSNWPFNNLYIGKNGSKGIYYVGTNSTKQMITFLDNTSDTYGNGIKIGGGGTVVVGAGESAANLSVTAGTETLYLTSDGAINIEAGCDTIANRVGIQVTAAGHVIPVKAEAAHNNAQDLGSSSAKWANIYGTTFSHTHIAGSSDGFKVLYGSTIDFFLGVGTANENHGLYDNKANKWILSAGAANTWTFVGNVTGNVSGSSGSCTGNAATASKISAKLAATTKTYLLGTSTAITATAANVDITGDTGVYLTTTAGELSAVRHSWNASGTEKAYTIYNTTDDSIDFVFI